LDIITLMVIAVALGTDAFSMAVGLGACGIRYKQTIIISLAVLMFHIIMPLIGLSLGALLGRIAGQLAAVIGAVVLILIGIFMVRDGFKGDDGETAPLAMKFLGVIRKQGGNFRVAPGFWGIIVLASSVSLDALTVGFSLGALQFNLLLTVLTLGIVAGLMTALGFAGGKKLGCWFGDRAQIIGGLILVVIGIKMLFI